MRKVFTGIRSWVQQRLGKQPQATPEAAAYSLHEATAKKVSKPGMRLRIYRRRRKIKNRIAKMSRRANR